MINDLIAFQKLYDLILYINPIINKFPKEQRFVLGQNIENKLIYILSLIIKINSKHGPRKEYYKTVSIEFDILFVYIRLAHDLNFISTKQYAQISEKTNEVIKICCN
jgi:hypothetical protein